MAPLIDVVFLLLIFFMLTFAVQGQGMDISLPKGQSVETPSGESLVIKIGDDQKIMLNNKLVALEKLQEELENKLSVRSSKTVVIVAKQKSRYGLFAKVLDKSRLAGAEGFSIVK
jgi:biopolymer transport protein ExbD